jgi:hypothetical protein
VTALFVGLAVVALLATWATFALLRAFLAFALAILRLPLAFLRRWVSASNGDPGRGRGRLATMKNCPNERSRAESAYPTSDFGGRRLRANAVGY